MEGNWVWQDGGRNMRQDYLGLSLWEDDGVLKEKKIVVVRRSVKKSPGKRSIKCKGPEAETNLNHSRSSRKPVLLTGWVSGVWGTKVRDIDRVGSWSLKGLRSHGKEFKFFSEVKWEPLEDFKGDHLIYIWKRLLWLQWWAGSGRP